MGSSSGRNLLSTTAALSTAPTAGSSLMVDVSPLGGPLEGIDQPVFDPRSTMVAESALIEPGDTASFELQAPIVPPSPGRLTFDGPPMPIGYEEPPTDTAASADSTARQPSLNSLATLKPLGQLRESFILATNDEGLWIIDQHVAHERVLFEKILRERQTERVERQRLLMPMLIDLLPQQMVVFSSLAAELDRNGCEAEPFGPHTIAIKAAPSGLSGNELERMIHEVLEQPGASAQSDNLETARTRIAASIACHAAIKVNMPLDPARMEWLLAALARTDHPTSCPHGRPIALRYSWKDIQRAFQRI